MKAAGLLSLLSDELYTFCDGKGIGPETLILAKKQG